VIDWKAAARGFRDRWRDADQAGMSLARENVRFRAQLAEVTARADRLAVAVEELRAAFIQHRTATHEVAPKFCKTCRESDAVLAVRDGLI
jgi:hypothetical protein